MARLREKLSGSAFLVTAEVDPPRGVETGPLIERVSRLCGWVDAVNVTDCPRANVRMSAIAAAHLIERATGMETVFHLTCRDRNIIGLQSDLLGAAALGLSNLLVLTGDPPRHGQHPDAHAVFELDTPGLIRLVTALNGGTTAAARPLEGPTRLTIAAAANPSAPDPERELHRLAEKVAAGAHFVQTQPVFDAETALAFEEKRAEWGIDLPVLYGILPLRDAAFARRMAAIPGVRIPETVLRRVETGGPGEGRRLAAELAATLYGRVRGLHLFPMGDVDDVLAVTEALAARGRRAAACPRPAPMAGVGG